MFHFGISAGPLGHHTVEPPLNSFRFMFLIHQAFQPPVFCSIIQSSSTRSSNVLLRILQYSSIRANVTVDSSARPPLAKNRYKVPALRVLSRPGGGFSATPLAFCALGVHFQRPLSHSVLQSVKNTWESAPLRFFTPSCPSCWPSCPSCWPSWRQHVPQVLARCPKNAILEPTSPKKCFSHLFKHPEILKKLCFPKVFVGFLLSSPCAKIGPSWRQLGSNLDRIGHNWPQLRP